MLNKRKFITFSLRDGYKALSIMPCNGRCDTCKARYVCLTLDAGSVINVESKRLFEKLTSTKLEIRYMPDCTTYTTLKDGKIAYIGVLASEVATTS
jgi:hypothetical protein